MRVIWVLMTMTCLAGAQDLGGSVRAKVDPKLDRKVDRTVDSRIEVVNAAMDSQDYDKALKLLVPMAAADPKNARILYDLGSAQDGLDQGLAAETSYRAAIADDAKFLDPHVALGLMLARGGRLAEARMELLAVKVVPTEDKLVAGRAYRALSRLDQKSLPVESRDELLEALKLSAETPDDTLLAAELAQSASHGAGAAEEAYRRFLIKMPDDPAATSELAGLLMKQLRATEAEALLTGALKAHPGNPVLMVQLAILYARQGKKTEALSLAKDLYESGSQDANAAHLLAGLYLDAEDYLRAEPLLAALSLEHPRDATVVADRGRALIHLKRFAEAQEILTRIVAQPMLFATPGDLGNAAGDLAFAASSNNDPKATLQALDVRATVLPTSAPVLFLKAISYDKLRQVKLATEAYRDFLEASKGLAGTEGANPDEEFEARHRLIALEHRN